MYYNETAAHAGFRPELGIPADDIVWIMPARTYDTLLSRRRNFWGALRNLVTMPITCPALVTCRGLGIDSSGVIADRREYNPASFTRWRIREVPATLVAFLDVFLIRPLPILGNPEPIFSSLPSAKFISPFEFNHGS